MAVLLCRLQSTRDILRFLKDTLVRQQHDVLLGAVARLWAPTQMQLAMEAVAVAGDVADNLDFATKAARKARLTITFFRDDLSFALQVT